MEKLQFIRSEWQDHVGATLINESNDGAYRINDSASDTVDVVKRVDDTKRDPIKFKSRTPEIVELKNRLMSELNL